MNVEENNFVFVEQLMEVRWNLERICQILIQDGNFDCYFTIASKCSVSSREPVAI